MDFDPGRPRVSDSSVRHLSRGLVVALVLGTILLLGILIWFLRLGGAVWR